LKLEAVHSLLSGFLFPVVVSCQIEVMHQLFSLLGALWILASKLEPFSLFGREFASLPHSLLIQSTGSIAKRTFVRLVAVVGWLVTKE
jgi:hypothetical protein